MANTIEYYCGKCDRILVKDDGVIKKDAQGIERCPVCGEKVYDTQVLDKEWAKIETDIDNELAKDKQG